MPPCTSVSDFGEFCEGGGPFTDEESVMLQDWLQAGAPEGSPSQPAKTPELDAWRLGKPDAILQPISSIDIPEEGAPFWKAFAVPLGRYEGRRLRAFDIQVSQPKIVRSVTVAVAREGLMGTRRAMDGWQTGGSLEYEAHKFVGGWAPGYPAWQLPQDVAMTMDGPALVVQLLYLPLGRPSKGDFKIGLYFSKNERDLEPQWLHMNVEEFAVPAPGNLVLTPEGTLPPKSRLIAVLPEARYFCTAIHLSDGHRNLFTTRKWDPYWQGPYRYHEPVEFPDGAKLAAFFDYDNDIHMGHNEGKRPRPILAGPRERDELCRMHVLYVTKSKQPSP